MISYGQVDIPMIKGIIWHLTNIPNKGKIRDIKALEMCLSLGWYTLGFTA